VIDLGIAYCAENPVPGALCEFGVYQGHGLYAICQYAEKLIPGAEIYGFDSFEGMPKTEIELTDNHAEVWRPGGFSETSVERVRESLREYPSVKLIKGVFSDLKPLPEYGIDRVRFARIDCDIYEGYRDALNLLTPCIGSGTVLLFDEGVSIPDPQYQKSIQDSGERAIAEWKDRTGFKLKTLCQRPNWTEILTVIE
jgi:hypothetical protein